MEVRSYRELLTGCRKSDTAIFFGCGPSINDLTKEDWEILKRFDTWAVNFFLYHDFIVPRFLFRGFRKYDRAFRRFVDLLDEKRKAYKDTIFLTRPFNHAGVEKLGLHEIFVVDLVSGFSKRRAKRITHGEMYRESLKGFRIMEDKIYFFGKASLCPLLVLMYQMGYEEIVLYGNDLVDRAYFWSDRSVNEVHWRWNRDRRVADSFVPKANHPNKTSLMMFVPFFSREYMGNRIFVGNKKTPLYPEISYKSIEEIGKGT